MEDNLSMPELVSILEAKHKEDYEHKKFLAALKGVDLDGSSGKKINPWEAMKARVMSGGKTSDPYDVVSLQGYSAQRAGFGIGMGLDYEVIDGDN
jgi:hypothetical protein